MLYINPIKFFQFILNFETFDIRYLTYIIYDSENRSKQVDGDAHKWARCISRENIPLSTTSRLGILSRQKDSTSVHIIYFLLMI